MTAQTVQEAQALLRLRRMREEAARVSMVRCREQQAECQRIVEKRLVQLTEARRCRSGLLGEVHGPGAALAPRTWPYASARLAALDDELERAEVELVDERDDLQQAGRALDAARAAWVREQARRRAVDELLTATRQAHAARQAQRLEREVEHRPVQGA